MTLSAADWAFVRGVRCCLSESGGRIRFPGFHGARGLGAEGFVRFAGPCARAMIGAERTKVQVKLMAVAAQEKRNHRGATEREKNDMVFSNAFTHRRY